MLYVYLAYALSFVIMGFAMAFQSFSYFRVLPRVPLLLLAGFGITHGMFELQRMLQIIEMRGIANASPVPIDYASMFLLPISFMLLFAFAIELLIHEEFIARYWRASYFLAPLLLGSLVIFPAWSKFQTIGHWPLRLEVATRYFLAFPSGTLSSYALLKIAGRIPVHERFQFRVAMYAAAVVLLIYGIVAGLLVFNPTGFEGFPEHGISTAPILLGIRTLAAASLTLVISYAFIIELANVESRIRTLRDEFSSALTHDIANILAAIRMSSDAIHFVDELSNSKLGETTQRLMRTIDSNTRLLESLISDLFDLSLIELHRLSLDRKRGDLCQVINEICEQMRPTLDKRSMVLLMPETELLANFDGQRVGQMLINLLSNAVKCSFLNSEVIVSAYDSGQNVKVTVTSTGPAIEKTEASQLFTRYYRSKRTSGQKGAGLGLFIVKELAEAHGGTVFVESHKSGKTAFGFIIPKNGSKAEAVEGDFTALRDHQSEENAQGIPRHH